MNHPYVHALLLLCEAGMEHETEFMMIFLRARHVVVCVETFFVI